MEKQLVESLVTAMSLVRDCLVNGGAVSGEGFTGGIVGMVANSAEGIFIHGCQSSANISGKYLLVASADFMRSIRLLSQVGHSQYPNVQIAET